MASEDTRYCHMGYSFQLASRALLYASSHRQDNTYHSLCYTCRGALAGMTGVTGSDVYCHVCDMVPIKDFLLLIVNTVP